MPAPVPFIGFDPPDSPGRLSVNVDAGGSGGGAGGLVLRPVKGISIAFGQGPNTEIPLWHNLEELGPQA